MAVRPCSIYWFSLFFESFILVIIDKDSEPKGIVFVMPETEPIIDQQESICSSAITVEELVTLPKEGVVFSSHRIIDLIVIGHLPVELLILFPLLLKETELLTLFLPHLDLQ